MYRRLVILLVLLLTGSVLLWAALGLTLHQGHLQSLLAALHARGILRLRSNMGLFALVLLQSGLGIGALCLVMGLGAFHPVRRPPAWVAAVRYALLALSAAYALFALYDTVRAIGTEMLRYRAQIDHGILLTLFGAMPHRVVEIGALALALGAPVYMLVRSVQVSSLRQASFEGWLELRRHWRWIGGLLLAAALTEVYISPAITVFLLRQ